MSPNNPQLAERVNFALYRSAEEFYNYTSDPQAMTNLAGKQEHIQRQKVYRSKLLDHLVRSKDPLVTRFKEHIERHPL